MANIVGIQTLNNVLVISTDIAPNIGSGTFAPVGSFGSAENGSGVFYKSGIADTAWYKLLQSNNSALHNILVVCKNPEAGQYATIEAALAAITTNSPTNPFVIAVGVGIFFENQLNCKPYVSIVGTAIQSSIIKPIGNHDLFVVTDVMTELSFMSLQNVPSGKAAIFCNDCGNFFQAHKLNFIDCDINVKVVSLTKDTEAYLEYIDYNGVMSYGNYIISNGGFSANINCENYYSFPTVSGFISEYISGTSAELQVLSSGIYGTPEPSMPPVAGNFGIICENGAEINIVGSNISGFQCGFQNNNIGAGCSIDIQGVTFDNNIHDIRIISPLSIGGFNGSADLSKITIDPLSTFSSTFTQAHIVNGGIVITGDIYNGQKVADMTEVTTLIKNQSMGVIDGGYLSNGGGFQVDILAGVGYLLDGTILKKVTWGNMSIMASANQTRYVYFNSFGVLSLSPSEPIFYSNIILGRVNTNGSSIEFLDRVFNWSSRIGNRTIKMIRGVFGALYESGSVTTENVTPLKIGCC